MSGTQLSPRVDLGGVTITIVSGGALRLDGGAMFGIIPKALWSRTCAADEQNRIQLACNCVLIEWTGPVSRRALIEVGHGPKYAEKEQKMFMIDPQRWLLPNLQAAGVEPDSIDDVILSHLHFDHAGGLTHDLSGEPAPTFPRARVHVQRREFDDARANFGIMTMTYREENYRPLDQRGLWHLLDGPGEIVPGVHSLISPGHTRGHHSLWIEGRERSALFLGDVMPTRHHLGAAYNMGYDLLPLDNRRSKQTLLELAAQREWVVIIDHDPETPLVSIGAAGPTFTAQPLQ